MKNFDSSGFQKLSVAVAMTALMTFTSQGAFAATPGCNAAVQQAAEAKAEAMAAVDKAAADQIQKMPTSVLNTTCFNEAAGVSATAGGNIFSGDFSSNLMPVVNTALQSFSDDFEGSIVDFFTSTVTSLVGGNLASLIPGSLGGLLTGGLGGLFGSGANTVATSFDCDGIKTIQESVLNEGVTSGIKMPTLAEMMSGTLPTGVGEKFKKSFNASSGQNVFSNLNSAVLALPKPAAPNFASAQSLCDNLMVAGIVSSCP